MDTDNSSHTIYDDLQGKTTTPPVQPPQPPPPPQPLPQQTQPQESVVNTPPSAPRSPKKVIHLIVNILLVIGFLAAAIAIFLIKPEQFLTQKGEGTPTPEISASPDEVANEIPTTELQPTSPTANSGTTTQSPTPASQPSPSEDRPVITSPQPNATVKSPLIVRGKAPGTWFFEGQLVVKLVDSNRKLIAQGAGKEVNPNTWMTFDLVDFQADIPFSTTAKKGYVQIQNDNPSGIPENQKSFEVPVTF